MKKLHPLVTWTLRTLVLSLFLQTSFQDTFGKELLPQKTQKGVCCSAASMEYFCTMEFAIMYNESTKECVVGKNGCVISTLMKKGFRRAIFEECPDIFRENI